MRSAASSLASRLTGAIALVLIGCTGCISYLCLHVAADSVESGARHHLHQLAAMAAADLDNWVLTQESALKAAASIGGYLRASPAEQRRIEPLVRESLNAIMRSSPVFIAGVALLDAQMNLILATEDHMPTLIDRTRPLAFEDEPVRRLLHLKFYPEGEEPRFNLYRPIYENGELLGVILVNYRNAILDRLLMHSALQGTASLPVEGFLVDENGKVLRHLALDADGLVEVRDASLPSAQGPAMLEASEPMNFARWRVHFAQPHSMVLVALLWNLVPWLLALLVFIGLILYLSHLAVQRTMRPLRSLTTRVQHTLEMGPPVRVMGRVKDEVKTLAQAFDDLFQRLNHTVEDLRSARDQAECANRIKSEFLAHMSHEIRTPLTAIVGFSELMQESAASGEAFDNESMGIIERNARHLLALVNDILDFSKIEAQELHLHEEPFEPIRIIQDVQDSLLAKAREKKLRLFQVYDQVPEGLTIIGDPLRFKQVLMNLVDNGIKYTEKGQVGVNVSFQASRHEAGELIMVISDTGIGMAASELHKLFQPFSQLSTRSSKTPGTGLGLAICRRLAQMMDGDISCESRPGCGSRFTWRMKVQVHHAGLDPTESPLRSLGAPAVPLRLESKTRILIAEDARDSQELLRWILETAGATVTIATNGREAIEEVSRHESADAFDLVLMDIGMPVVNGYEATEELRKRGFTRPILALTAHATAGDRDRCVDAGCSDYLTKPIDRNTLLTKISRHVPDFHTLH